MAMDYYKVLAVSSTATEAEIKRSFRKLAMKIHPDSNPNPNAHTQFLQLNEAYQILSNPLLRARYDRQLQQFRNGNAQAFEKRPVYRPPSPTPSGPSDMSDEERERRYQEAKRKQQQAIYQEFKQYTPYVRILSFIAFAFVALLLLDWGLTQASEPEAIVDTAEFIEPGQGLVCEFYTATQAIRINCNRLAYYLPGDQIQLYKTPIFGTIHRLKLLSELELSSMSNQLAAREFTPKPGIYNVFAFFWVMLLGFAIGGLWFKKKPEYQFRFGLGMLGLIPLNMLMLFLS